MTEDQDRIRALENENRELKATIGGLRYQIEDLEAEIDETEVSLDSEKAAADSEKAAADRARERVWSVEASLLDLRNELQVLEKVVATASRRSAWTQAASRIVDALQALALKADTAYRSI